MTKIKEITSNYITFENGYELYSKHITECCEEHYLAFDEIKENAVENIKELEFDLNNGGNFFERVPNYGIRLLPLNGHLIFIPGYASNNGYYSNNLTLVLETSDGKKYEYNITECQKY